MNAIPNNPRPNRQRVPRHELFGRARKAFLDDVRERIPHAYKAVRIKKLARASDAFEKSKNYLAMARMLEQIAKECGGAFTNRREITGKGRGPIEYKDVETMTDEQLDLELKQLLAQSGHALVPIN